MLKKVWQAPGPLSCLLDIVVREGAAILPERAGQCEKRPRFLPKRRPRGILLPTGPTGLLHCVPNSGAGVSILPLPSRGQNPKLNNQKANESQCLPKKTPK